MTEAANKPAKSQQCDGTIEKDWRGHGSCLWRRQCRRQTRHPSGYCQDHRVSHTTYRK